ncbi:MAG: GntR family transcriptional regulator [Thalassobaculales bacterium]
MSTEPSQLAAQVARRILEIAAARALPAGARLTEAALAADLAVSRTPVRAALRRLEASGHARPGPGRGYVLARPVAPAEVGEAAATPAAAEENLQVAIARDRLSGDLPESVSEADLLRRYGVARSVMLRVLSGLAEAGVVERRPGYGWAFRVANDSPESRAESYRFRLVIEPAALLEPSFRLDPAWAQAMRARHLAAMAAPWHDGMAVAFYEMNAAFHEGLARASGNRFILAAVQQQNRMRRFTNIHWTYGHQRVLENTREHIAILDCLAAGDGEMASLLMRRHLQGAARLVPAAFRDFAAR